jgi:hypothetical protein
MHPIKARSEKNQPKIFTFSPDYVRGMKQKLRTSRNKISLQIPVTGAQCTVVWAIHDGNAPYWRTHHFLMGHFKF